MLSIRIGEVNERRKQLKDAREALAKKSGLI